MARRTGVRADRSDCENDGIGRRDLLKFGTAGIVALGLGHVSWQARAAEGAATVLSPDEALVKLKSGNQRYVSHLQFTWDRVDLRAGRMWIPGDQQKNAEPHELRRLITLIVRRETRVKGM